MPDIKFDKVVSFSSEDEKFPASNLIKNPPQKWRCGTQGVGASVILQLDQPSKITSIDIGNENSSFIDISVGKSSNSDFEPLLTAQNFMNPVESKLGNNMNKVRFFTKDQLCSETREQYWDQIRVSCSQVYNKNASFGIAFIRLRSDSEKVRRLSDDNGLSSKKTTSSTPAARSKLFDDLSPMSRRPAPEASPKLSANLREESKRLEQRSYADKPPSTNQGPKRSFPWESDRSEAKPPAKKPSITPVKPKEYIGVNDSPAATPTMEVSEIMNGVVFVLSGFQNPHRGDLRAKAIQMGAKYKQDWTKGCTHLICAFKNTPKFKQVLGKGKIVAKDWILQCFKRKRRLPWKPFRMDGDPDSSDSEDENARKSFRTVDKGADASSGDKDLPRNKSLNRSPPNTAQPAVQSESSSQPVPTTSQQSDSQIIIPRTPPSQPIAADSLPDEPSPEREVVIDDDDEFAYDTDEAIERVKRQQEAESQLDRGVSRKCMKLLPGRVTCVLIFKAIISFKTTK